MREGPGDAQDGLGVLAAAIRYSPDEDTGLFLTRGEAVSVAQTSFR
eukprot:CAMPEP_0118903926 /NCGR_PEP_ID=MMETSP1166-20130328/8608_1 /TAXON_ID=1104430 /ORGANISM="Chrysoreinhardia sp, Strain CCMP3193" /LENGTH=45 /DNA_ID= /DNA_START= /DNA_END= /DNA_ORIENTATION=